MDMRCFLNLALGIQRTTILYRQFFFSTQVCATHYLGYAGNALFVIIVCEYCELSYVYRIAIPHISGTHDVRY